LPETNLSLSYHNAILSVSGSGTLVYSAPCHWAASFSVPPTFVNFYIHGNGSGPYVGCGYYQSGGSDIGYASGSVSGGIFWDLPSGCCGNTPRTLNLMSYSCTPLSLVFSPSGAGSITFTVLP